MRVGWQIFNANTYGDKPFRLNSDSATVTDAERIRAELELISLADEAGIDTVWASEHHFSSYMTSPNLSQILSHVVGVTKNVDVGTAVIVLPWHDPVRVAEEVAMLDILVRPRKLFVGFGRGASTIEYEGFRVPMSESRGRYNEALEIVRTALTTERFSYAGEYFQIPEMTTHPRPESTDLTSRMYCAFFSPESMERAARDGLGALFAVGRDLEMYPQEVRRFNAIRAETGLPPMPTKIASFIYCSKSRAEAEEKGSQHVVEYQAALENHYHWSSSEQYKKIDSYQFYADLGEKRAKASRSETVEAVIRNCLFGTPEDIVEKVEAMAEASGCDEIISPFLYGQMPFEEAEHSLHLFLAEALPKIHELPVKQMADQPNRHQDPKDRRQGPPTVAAI